MNNSLKLVLASLSVVSIAILLTIIFHRKEYTLFYIPETTTPAELDKRGFDIHRNVDLYWENDVQRKGTLAHLQKGTCYVNVRFADNDTQHIVSHEITLACSEFTQLTGKQVKDGKHVRIEGIAFRIVHTPPHKMLLLKRVGLRATSPLLP